MVDLTENAGGVQWLEISAGEAGQRVDNYLLSRLKGVPKSRIYRLLRKGEVRVNKGRIKPEYKLAAGDVLRLPPIRLAERDGPPPVGEGLAARLRDAVLYEDAQILVVDKPSGLAVHGGSGVNLGLIEALRQLRPELQQLELVHRLDRETSGCLLLAKQRGALRALQRVWRAGGIDKQYLALVTGAWPPGLELIDAPLLKNELRSGERVVRVDDAGKPSRTAFAVRERFQQATLMEAEPITGRTHQIRVHARHGGHPLLGDDKYGDAGADQAARRDWGLKRLFLHASRLRFPHPESGATITVEAPLPPELQAVLARARHH